MKRVADENDIKWLLRIQNDLHVNKYRLNKIKNGFFEIFDKKQVSTILFRLLDKETTRNKRAIIKILSYFENEKLLPILASYLKTLKKIRN